MIVIGGGISGVAAARRLAAASRVVVIDRGYRLGGRMSSMTLEKGPWAGHIVDIGAGYFTASTPEFTAVVDDWIRRGLARPWTNTMAIADSHGISSITTGPMRYTAVAGLRSLVEDIASHPNITVQLATEVLGIVPEQGEWSVVHAPRGTRDGDTMQDSTIAVCMPGSQASHLVSDDLIGIRRSTDTQMYRPAMTLIAEWSERVWDPFAAAFVNDDPALTKIADDGDRRADWAPILVATSTHEFAASHGDDRPTATRLLVDRVKSILGIDADPIFAEVKLWRSAQPDPAPPPAPEGRFILDPRGVGVANDALSSNPRIEAAWCAGHALGSALSEL